MRSTLALMIVTLIAGCASPTGGPTADPATHSGYGGHIDNGTTGRFKTGGIMGGSMSDQGRRPGTTGSGTSTQTDVDVLDLRDTSGRR